MPERDKGEDGDKVDNAVQARGTRAAEGDVDVAGDPAVKGAVPGAPEGEGRVVVRHAAEHVLGRVDVVDQRPEAEEAPGDQQLQPDDVQVEVGQH